MIQLIHFDALFHLVVFDLKQNYLVVVMNLSLLVIIIFLILLALLVMPYCRFNYYRIEAFRVFISLRHFACQFRLFVVFLRCFLHGFMRLHLPFILRHRLIFIALFLVAFVFQFLFFGSTFVTFFLSLV